MKIAVLISGSGRTLKNFIDLVAEGSLAVEIALVVSSSAKAGGLEFARAANIPTAVLPRRDYDTHEAYGDAIFGRCRDAGVDLVAMAGFLKFAPVPDDFMGRVVNIHPSLLPAFGGQGMYGHAVHQAVLDYGAKITGVTVHFVDNQYDHGPVIWQQPVPVFDDDTADSLTARVFEVEKDAYPHVLKLIADGRLAVEGRRVVTRRSAGRSRPTPQPPE